MKIPTLEVKERPLINSTFISSPSTWGEPRSLDLPTLVHWVKRTPECIGILKRIATDIVTDASFTAIDNKPLVGRPANNWKKDTEDNAIGFWNKNNGKEKIYNGVLDWLMTGDAYLWMGLVSDIQFKEIAVRHYKNFGINLDESEIQGLKSEYKEFFDEDPNAVNAIETIPSSMVTIDHDDIKIKKYIQKSKVNPKNKRIFYPDEVIHFKFMSLDGKVYAFSPFESAFYAIKTINAIQDYNYNYFANGVKLQRAWVFSGNIDPNYQKKLEEVLQKYKNTRFAQSDIILTGADKIETVPLNQIGEEMEFRKLAIAAVGRLAFAFNMPADILSSILGADIKGTAIGSDVEDAGYNRNIIEAQKYWEANLNAQLFNPYFKVNIEFERTFRQDMIRQSQYLAQTIPYIDFIFNHKIPVSDEYIFNMLQIPRKYRTEGKINRNAAMAMPFGSVSKPMSGENQQAYSKTKKAQQKPQQTNSSPVGS
jgi:hypothetical protein